MAGFLAGIKANKNKHSEEENEEEKKKKQFEEKLKNGMKKISTAKIKIGLFNEKISYVSFLCSYLNLGTFNE